MEEDRALPLTEHENHVYMDHGKCTNWITMLSLKVICSRNIFKWDNIPNIIF